jgi:hypothetical protein
MTLSPDFSFHLRFKEVALVSHFRGIDRKHETSACFVGDLPMREALKTLKRDRH